MAYTTAAQISDYLQRALTTDETDWLAILIPAIQIWIDLKTNSTFDVAVESSRYYDGGLSAIQIEPATEITEVTTVQEDSTLTEDTPALTENVDFLLEPYNSTVKNQIVKRHGYWPYGKKNLKVTAKFSEYDGGVPSDIAVIATRIAAGIINAGKVDSSGGNVASESLEGHSITYDTSQTAIENITSQDAIIQSSLQLRTNPVVE